MPFMNSIFLVLLSLCISVNAFANTGSKVSLRDKIGQMLIMGFDGKTVNGQSAIIKAIDKDNIGGVLLFDYDYNTKTYDKNIESPNQLKQLTSDLQSFTTQLNLKHHRPQLPLLISVDYEGGQVNRLKEEYGFPPTLSAEKVGRRSASKAEQSAEAMAVTLNNAGINLDFAPVLDLNVNPDNPIIGKKERSFSADPLKAAQYAAIYSRHFINKKIQCAYKHFPGHGSSLADSHLGFVDVTETWQSYELDPYKNLLNHDSSCGVVMTAHIVNRQLDETGLPATLSHKILTGLLRKQLHFNGIIVSDDMHMKAITDNYTLDHALVLTINAGTDMLIFGNNLAQKPEEPEKLIDIIEAKVLNGEISEERINQAYQRIMRLKQFR